ncbi:hypothetical protein LCGC14_1692870 [marine sediment metagenome]|uniref:Uncharacterized protein n=1 Tax=marine sediment metagenome TaxID=412755 RepID=A0A0F9K0S8_9ZZZZ
MVAYLPPRASEPDDTRGLSQRELILRLMTAVEKLNQGMGKRPTRLELYGTLGFTVTAIVGISALL